MKVTTELIEKYNLGQCTPSEVIVVEHWLWNDDSSDEIEISPDFEMKLKAEIWNEISDILPSKSPRSVTKLFQDKFQWAAIAAAVTILMVVSAAFLLNLNSKSERKSAFVKSETKVLRVPQQEIRTEDFNIVLGDKSKASFDLDKGLVDFCGAIKISPKKDIRLSFNDLCAEDSATSKGIDFKKGQTYFALNYRNQESDRVVVMNENLIFELPPLLKNELSDQFDI